ARSTGASALGGRACAGRRSRRGAGEGQARRRERDRAPRLAWALRLELGLEPGALEALASRLQGALQDRARRRRGGAVGRMVAGSLVTKPRRAAFDRLAHEKLVEVHEKMRGRAFGARAKEVPKVVDPRGGLRHVAFGSAHAA